MVYHSITSHFKTESEPEPWTWNTPPSALGGAYFPIPPQWVGGRLFGASAIYFYENGRNSKSRIIDPKLGNKPSLQGLPTGRWQTLGTYSRKWIFGPKTEFSGPKKAHFFTLTMLGPRPGKVVQTKKTFSQVNISLLANFECFFLEKTAFGQKNIFWPNIKASVSPKFQQEPGPLSLWVIFLMARTVSTSFVDQGPKLRVLVLAKWEWPEMAKKPRWAQRNGPLARKRKFFSGWSEWKSCSPGYTGDMPCRQKLRFQIWPIWSRARPKNNANTVPRWSFRYVGTKTFASSRKKLGFLAQKNKLGPKICICGHFGPNLGVFGAFGAMPDQ